MFHIVKCKEVVAIHSGSSFTLLLILPSWGDDVCHESANGSVFLVMLI